MAREVIVAAGYVAARTIGHLSARKERGKVLMVLTIRAKVEKGGLGGQVVGNKKVRARARGVWRRMVEKIRVTWGL